MLVLKAQLVALEAKTGELLENQENAASEVATALQAIISRLLDLVTELMSSYNITEQDLEVSLVLIPDSHSRMYVHYMKPIF